MRVVFRSTISRSKSAAGVFSSSSFIDREHIRISLPLEVDRILIYSLVWE